MPVPATAADFVELVRKSKLVDAPKLDAFLRDHPIAELAKPREIADAMVELGLISRFQSSQLLAGKWNGFYLGKYKVIELIGLGGMGQVFLAEHVAMRRRVALKVLPADHAQDEGVLKRFHLEAQAAGALAHPNLVRAYDVDREGRWHFLVLEYVDGASLQEIVSQHGPLDPNRAGQYIWQAALGLQHAHDAGLVHRDIKPANLLIDRQGVVKILDLGLARFFGSADDSLTTDGESEPEVFGTADYLSPEQAINSNTVDIRADIYSLGATAYFILTGKAPFEGETIAQKLVSHQMRQPKPLREIRPEIPEDLASIISRMLDKKPERRFQTPAELAIALARFGELSVPPPAAHEFRDLGIAAGRGPAAGLSSIPPASELLRAAARTTLAGTKSSRKLSINADAGRKVGSDASAGKGAEKRASLWPFLALAGLLIAFAAWYAWPRTEPKGPLERGTALTNPGDLNPAKPARAPTVSVAFSPRGEFPTIAAAIAAAQPGDRIELRGKVAEIVSLKNGQGKGVTLEGDGSAVWEPPADASADQPCLSIDGIEGMVLKNIVFSGSNRASVLIFCSGLCPGLTLDRVELRDFKSTGVRLFNASGEPTRPIVLKNFRAIGPKDAIGSIVVDADPIRPSQSVQILDGRLEGEVKADIRVAGPMTDVAIRGNRFFGANAGVRVDLSPDSKALQLQVVQNTFTETGSPISFSRMPSADSTVRVEKNLFTQSKILVKFDDIKTSPTQSKAKWIWFGDDFSNEGYPPDDRFFRRWFELAKADEGAMMDIMGDDSATVWINGQLVGKFDYNHMTLRIDAVGVGKYLKAGRNLIAVCGTNGKNAKTELNPAGLAVRIVSSDSQPVELLTTDADWKGSKEGPMGWNQEDYDDALWKPVRVQRSFEQQLRRFHWDSVTKPAFGERFAKLFAGSEGNVSDRSGVMPFDMPKVVYQYTISLPVDAQDDASFLRYPLGGEFQKKYNSPGAGPVKKSP